MAVEEKKKSGAWVNPFSNMRNNQGPFLVDEKGFGKFHIINLGSPKQQGAGDENKPNMQGEGPEAEQSQQLQQGLQPLPGQGSPLQSLPPTSQQQSVQLLQTLQGLTPQALQSLPPTSQQQSVQLLQTLQGLSPQALQGLQQGLTSQQGLSPQSLQGLSPQPTLIQPSQQQPMQLQNIQPQPPGSQTVSPQLQAIQLQAVQLQGERLQGMAAPLQLGPITEIKPIPMNEELPVPLDTTLPDELPPEDTLSPPPLDFCLEPEQFPEREDLPIVKPSKPISPFMRFSSKIWAQVRDQKKGMKFADVGKMIGAKWRNLDEVERTYYQEAYDKDKVAYFKEMNSYRKYIEQRDAKALLEAQLIQDAEDPNDPLAQLINQISQLKQKSTSIEKEFMDGGLSSLSMIDLEKLITLENLAGANKVSISPGGGLPTAVKYEPCPNVNPFLIAGQSLGDSQKQLLQHRIMERIKNTATSSSTVSGAITNVTSSSFSSIPSTTNIRSENSNNENIRILKSLIPSYNQNPDVSNNAAPPNFTAPINPVPTETKQNTLQGGTGTMTPEQCQDMFQNIKKQITEQAVFGLTATIHQTSNENEGLILVVTRNKIDIHPQFGPIHVARVVITNKGYYKFFVLDKVVDSGQVGGKEISEVLWKLSEVSKHLLCPGFNQRYITKVEQTLTEKITDVSSSYCRLTAKLCNVWHQKDSKNGQRRNYHTRDLCAECLDLYYRLQSKTYALKQKQGGDKAPQKRDTTHTVDSVSKKPKLNGAFLSPTASPTTQQVNIPQALPPQLMNNSSLTYNSIEQQMRNALSTLVTNCSVVKVAKDQDNDQQIDILGDSADISTNNSQHLINQNIALLSQLNYQPHSQTTVLNQSPLPALSQSKGISNSFHESTPNQSILPMLALAKSAASQATNIPPNVVVLPNQVTLGARSGDATFILPNGGTVQSFQPDSGDNLQSRIQSSEQQLQALLQTLAPNLSKPSNQQQDALANNLKDALLKIGGGNIPKPQSFTTSEPIVDPTAAFVEAFPFAEGIGNIPTNSTAPQPNVETQELDNGIAPEKITVIESSVVPSVEDVNVDMSENTENTESNAQCLMDDSTEDSLVIQED